MVVAVTGANGQVGQALQYIAGNYPEITFHFASSSSVDITDKQSIDAFFSLHKPDFCINAAAYTAVDKAESEPGKAHAINVTGAKNLAEACREHGTALLHISTDFVFDGTKATPYTEQDIPNPQSVYGQTKLDGERAIMETLEEYYIIRTSWVYSQFGNNFMKTMLRLGAERDTLNVVNDQVGTPTHAVALATALLAIIKSGKRAYGLYHYSSEGSCSWYDFAKAIFEQARLHVKVSPIPASAYTTLAKRPVYSVLDKQSIKQVFSITIPHWKEEILNALKMS